MKDQWGSMGGVEVGAVGEGDGGARFHVVLGGKERWNLGLIKFPAGNLWISRP